MVTREILNSHPISTLKKEISKTNIKGYSKMKKAEVVDLMMKNKDRFSHIKHAEKKQRASGKPTKDIKKAIAGSDISERVAKTKDVKPKKEGATPDFTKDFGANLLKRLEATGQVNTYSKEDINSLLNYLLSKNFIKKSAIERLKQGDGSLDIDSTGYLELVLIDKLLNYVRLYGKFPSSSVFNEELRNRKRNLDSIKKSREWRKKYKDLLDYDRPAPTIRDVRRRASNKEEEEWLKQKLRGQGRLKK